MVSTRPCATKFMELNLIGIGPRHAERHAFDRGQIDHLGAVPVFTASFNWSAASLIEI